MSWLEQTVWRWLLRRMVKRATKLYGGPGELGEYFNTASFQQAFHEFVGVEIDGDYAYIILYDLGWCAGRGKCHWHARADL